MDKLLLNKDFDEIDNIFKLYTVMKQERDIGGYAYMIDEDSFTINSIQAKKLQPAQ